MSSFTWMEFTDCISVGLVRSKCNRTFKSRHGVVYWESSVSSGRKEKSQCTRTHASSRGTYALRAGTESQESRVIEEIVCGQWLASSIGPRPLKLRPPDRRHDPSSLLFIVSLKNNCKADQLTTTCVYKMSRMICGNTSHNSRHL